MDTYSNEQMLALTQAVVQQLDSWEISNEQMLTVLGLHQQDDIRPRHLVSFRNGDKAFPQTPELLERVGHIVGISDALRTTFPFSNQMRTLWLQKPHRRFQRRTPLDVILHEGAEGLQRVRIEVDCSYGYAINDALHTHQQKMGG